MQPLHFSIHINAPVSRVWDTMFSPETYREWTKVFDPSSHFEGSWEQGSTIRFIGTDKDGKEAGMISTIAENRPHAFMSIKHLGTIEKGVEKMESEWSGTLENYTFNEKNGGTDLEVDMTGSGANDEFVEYFKTTWPQALARLKELAETNS